MEGAEAEPAVCCARKALEDKKWKISAETEVANASADLSLPVSALIFHFLSSSAFRAQQTAGSASAPSIDPKSYAGMKWRLIGPFRGAGS